MSNEDSGDLVFARLSFGKCEFTLSPGTTTGPRDVSLWLYTDRVAELYRQLKARQMRAAAGANPPVADTPEVVFEEDLYTPFYGGQQFSIRDTQRPDTGLLAPRLATAATRNTALVTRCTA